MSGGLSKDEEAIYDRQLRVWGVEAQQRMRNSKVLVLGSCGAAIEVAKNLILAGIGLLHLVDDRTVGPDATLDGNFLVPATPEVVGTSVAERCAEGLREMNPLVDVSCETTDAKGYVERADDEQLGQYSAVLAFDMPATTVRAIDERCASLNIPLCACTSRGVGGWIFLNPQRHEYIVETSAEDDKTGEVKKTVEHKSMTGVGFVDVVEEMVARSGEAAAAERANPRRRKRRSALFDVVARSLAYELETGRSVSVGDAERLKGEGQAEVDACLEDYLEGACVPAVLAVLGGVLANDVIKLVSKKGALGIDRMFCYSVLDDAGWIM